MTAGRQRRNRPQKPPPRHWRPAQNGGSSRSKSAADGETRLNQVRSSGQRTSGWDGQRSRRSDRFLPLGHVRAATQTPGLAASACIFAAAASHLKPLGCAPSHKGMLPEGFHHIRSGCSGGARNTAQEKGYSRNTASPESWPIKVTGRADRQPPLRYSRMIGKQSSHRQLRQPVISHNSESATAQTSEN